MAASADIHNHCDMQTPPYEINQAKNTWRDLTLGHSYSWERTIERSSNYGKDKANEALGRETQQGEGICQRRRWPSQQKDEPVDNKLHDVIFMGSVWTKDTRQAAITNDHRN